MKPGAVLEVHFSHTLLRIPRVLTHSHRLLKRTLSSLVPSFLHHALAHAQHRFPSTSPRASHFLAPILTKVRRLYCRIAHSLALMTDTILLQSTALFLQTSLPRNLPPQSISANRHTLPIRPYRYIPAHLQPWIMTQRHTLKITRDSNPLGTLCFPGAS